MNKKFDGYDLLGNKFSLKKKPVLIPILSNSNTDLISKKISEIELKKKREDQRKNLFFNKKSKSLTNLKSISKLPTYEKKYLTKIKPHKNLDLDLITKEIKLSQGVKISKNGFLKKECKFKSTFYNGNEYEKMTKLDYYKLSKIGCLNRIGDNKDSSVYYSEESSKSITTKNSSQKKRKSDISLKKQISPFLFIKKTKQEVKKKILNFDNKKTHFSENRDISCFTDYKTLFNSKRKKKFIVENIKKMEKELEKKDEFNLNIIKHETGKNNSFYKKIVKPGKLPKKKNYFQKPHRFYNTITNLKENIKLRKFI